MQSAISEVWARADRPGVRAFFLSIAALGIALMLALYSGAAAEVGHIGLSIAAALIALLVATWVAVTLVPILAKRTPLRWISYKMEYRITREGWLYIGGIIVVALAALNTGNNLLFLILASLIAIILMSGILSDASWHHGSRSAGSPFMNAVLATTRETLRGMTCRRRELIQCAGRTVAGPPGGSTLAFFPRIEARIRSLRPPRAAPLDPRADATKGTSMIAWLLQKVLGTKHERELKRLRPRVAAINDLEPKIQKLTDEELRAKTAEFKQKLDNGATLDDILHRSVRGLSRGGQARAQHAALRRAAHRRHGAAPRRDRRDADRRRQDARRDAAGVPQRARRARACTSSR